MGRHLNCHSHREGLHLNPLGVPSVCQLRDQTGTKSLTAMFKWHSSRNKKNLVEAGQLLPLVSKALGFFYLFETFQPI